MLSSTDDRQGGVENWSKDRDRYVVLLHLYSLTEGDSAPSVTPQKIMRDLALSVGYADSLLRELIKVGFVRLGAEDRLVLTSQAVRYIEKEAGRRRSIRLTPEK